MYFTNKFESATYITRVFHFSSLSFNSTLFLKKKNMKLDTNFGSKGLNYTNKNFKDQIENFDKKSLLQSTIICEIMNSNFMQGKNTNYFSFC